MFVEMFEAGLGDAIVLDLVTAEGLQHRGTGVIVDD
jgi:NitT/TauT family transport system substrate-binding protein